MVLRAIIHLLRVGLLLLLLLLLLVDDLLVVSPEGVEVGELRLHELLDHGLIPQDKGLLREAVLGVLQ